MRFQIFKVMIFLLIGGVFAISCAPAEPLEVNITSLSACTGWDKFGKPIGVSQQFSSDIEQIYACGHLRTNNPPITLAVNWYFEDKRIGRAFVEDVNDYFYSPLKPLEENFTKGKYRIDVAVGTWVMQSTKFQIE